MKGGGIAHDDSGTGIILYSGDSGGPCIDPTGTIAGKEPVWGVLSSVDPTRPISCGTQPPANDPRFAVIVAAQAFRDWARSVLATNTPKVSFDIDLDTTPDEFAIKQIGANLYIEVKLSTLDTPVYLPPGGVPPLSGTGADRALIQHGDFNKNSVQDLFALINGIPIYVPGSAGVDLSNPPTTSLSLSSSYEYVTPARAPDDANKDGIDDLIATRSDGRQDIYLGNSSKGLTTAAYLYPRGFRFFDAADPQESFAVAAPSFSPRLDWAGGLKPSKGVVYLVSTDSAAKVWVDAFTLDKAAGFAAEDGDAFGQALAWGDFDKDTSRLAEIVIGAPGKTVNGVKRAGVVAWLGFSNNANFMYVLDRSSMGNSQAPAENDEFGHDLAVGDFDADDDDDLAIGQAGAVHVLKGTGTSGTGAPLTPQKTVDASTFGIGTTSLGYALTTGDFNCDGYEDLAIGIEGASVQGLTQAGTVVVSYGSSAGLNFPAAGSGGSWQKIDKTMNIEGGPPHAYDHFGYVLAAGNFNGDSYNGRPCTDLAIASEPLGQYTLEGTKFVFVGHVGAVHVIRGGPSGLSAVGSQRLEQGSMAGATPISDLAEFRDHFGGALAVTAADTDGFDDLIVGAWGEDDAAGAAHILRGSSQGIVATGQAVWRQDQLVPVQDKAAGDNFGATVGGTSNGLVLLSAPGESFAGATAGDPQIRQAGWVAAIRLSGSSPISYSGLAALTEPALSGKTPLREAGFLGRAVTAARPAFVPVQDAQVRFTGVIISDSGARLGDRCDGDVTPPVIDAIELSPGCIWPPNKKLVAYRLRDNLVVSATDNCDVSPEVRVKSVVVVDSKVKPSPGPAYLFGDNGFCLRADRGGDGSRTYLISIEARDSQGNSSVATASVTVPASLGAPATCAALAPASFTSEIDVRCQF